MPTPTYELVSQTTISSNVNTFTVSSLPQTYRDLVFVISGVSNSSTSIGYVYLNGDTGSNYSVATMEGNGSSTASTYNSGGTRAYLSFNYNFWGTGARNLVILNLLDYSTTDRHKNLLSRANGQANAVNAIINRWANTSAITSVQIDLNYLAGSKISIYGIAA